MLIQQSEVRLARVRVTETVPMVQSSLCLETLLVFFMQTNTLTLVHDICQ